MNVLKVSNAKFPVAEMIPPVPPLLMVKLPVMLPPAVSDVLLIVIAFP